MSRIVLFVGTCLIFIICLDVGYGLKAKKVTTIKNSKFEPISRAPAPAPNDCSECWCQCKRLSFRDKYGRVHGNCERQRYIIALKIPNTFQFCIRYIYFLSPELFISIFSLRIRLTNNQTPSAVAGTQLCCALDKITFWDVSILSLIHI